MIKWPTPKELKAEKINRRSSQAAGVTKGKMQVRVVVLAVVVALIFVILSFRLWHLQILSGESYSSDAQATQTRSVTIPAQRGVIYDRNEDVLATNRPGLNVSVIPASIEREQVERLANVLEANPEAVLERYDAAIEGGPSTAYAPILVKENAEKEDVTYVSERSVEFPGVQVSNNWVRSYPEGELAAHVLGYTGAITQEDLQTPLFRGLPQDSIVGRSGVELAYEEYLRGEPGSQEYQVDALGRIVNQGPGGVNAPSRITDPQPGNNLYLTLDMDLQRVAEQELQAAMQRARQEGYNGSGGAVVALDPRNGEILAMASWPTFDPSLFVGGITGEEEMEQYEYLTSEEANSPFTNRAIAGNYPAGSTFKVFTGIAGLDSGVITPSTTVTDDGGCWRPAGSVGGCWRSWRENYGTGTTHGTQNYAEALMDSNNIFFYQVADWMWQRTDNENLLPEYYMKFGFGDYTGFDLPGESPGRVPTREWQEEWGTTPDDQLWSVGRWVNLSIGQGDLLVTPLQIARGYAAIQNGGTLVTPHVGLEVRDQSGRLVKRFEPEPAGRVDLPERYFEATIRGLELVTGPDGTAGPAFEGSELDIVGKSGTGEMQPKDPVTWFAGWARNQENPLVVVAMIEEGGHSEIAAAPVVRHVLEAYYGVEQSPEDIFAAEDED
ncbi:penicillin-binding protein 2 [Rubrobacter taiwanensis]|uniref:Penicillin-binding protein 2 n=1 Tax=Rubrobacter taiwanensis TaxID=185139 RepID=A0A4V2NWG7_9ACTN|nr:penicillin-binding protein 2 [Rubrobacter taiwanensis]TCJ17362.1 penicillin-binding protein 2 [Rubrobacter taiwanensis]